MKTPTTYETSGSSGSALSPVEGVYEGVFVWVGVVCLSFYGRVGVVCLSFYGRVGVVCLSFYGGRRGRLGVHGPQNSKGLRSEE